MKKKLSVFLALVLALVMVVPAFAQSGVSGRLYDGESGDGDPDQPWQHGANIYILNCDSSGNILGTAVYGSIQLDGTETPTGEFSSPDWTADDLGVKNSDPAAGDYVCLYVVWNSSGVIPAPAPTVTAPQPYLSFVTGQMSFGNIQSGTGPTAVSLQSFSTEGGVNAMLPAAVGLLLLAGASFVIIRRRQQA